MASNYQEYEDLVERRLKHWRPEFEQKIQTQGLCTRLHAHDLLTGGKTLHIHVL